MEVSYSLSNQEDDDLNSYNISAFDLNFISGGDGVYSVDEIGTTTDGGNKSELVMEREQETDNEALSSLLMLSKANADADIKSPSEVSYNFNVLYL